MIVVVAGRVHLLVLSFVGFCHPFTGRRFPFRAGYGVTGPPAGRPNFGGPRDVDRSLARPAPPRREPYPLDDGNYSRPFIGRQYDDAYNYDDSHGLKRPYYMTVSYIRQLFVRIMFCSCYYC